ncbi:MAG: ATP-binding protein [Acidobacteria bacterium]|nr:ATP-binding protein [Acidobacteriota bacterium]
MDPVRNPYSPGAGNPPPALVGRDHELEAFDIAVQRLALGKSAKSQLLTGLRGVGKTVLLREFGQIAQVHGWVHEQIEATEDLVFTLGVATVVRKALLRLRVRERVRDRASRALGVLAAFRVRYQIPETGADLSFGFDPTPGRADSGILDDDLGELFVEVGQVAQADGVGVLLTIDEVQYLSQQSLAALILGLHRVSQEQLPFMVAGAGLPSLPGLAGEAKSYAERLFDFPVIGSLSEEDAAIALSRPAKDEGITWVADALAEVVDVTQGYPYFLQEFGKETWDVAPGPDLILKDDVAAAVPLAMDELDTGFFRARLDRTTDSERTYLRAMAGLGPGPYGSGAIAEGLGKTTAQVGPVRDSLLKRGLVYSPRWGRLAFTVPMFDEFLMRALGPLDEGG